MPNSFTLNTLRRLRRTVDVHLLAIFSYLVVPFNVTRGDHATELDAFLSKGQLVQSNEYFTKILASNPKDATASAALGLTQFLQAIESLGQANYQYGLISQHARQLPIARLPIPMNLQPQEITYADLRRIVGEFAAHLQVAENTLASVEHQPVQFHFYLGHVRLDLDDDGFLSDEETLWRIFATINRSIESGQLSEFKLGVDNADIFWLRGYCHVLMSFCDFVLAYDQSELFNRCGHILFPKTDSPYRTIVPSDDEDAGLGAYALDLIAAIHLARFPLIDADRMRSSHAHMLEMVGLSRECWKSAMQEIDNDHEWIPNPTQESVIDMRVSRDVVTGWHRVLDELEAILQGEKLIPFWRVYYQDFIFGSPQVPEEGIGINFKRFFLEPSDFDLVLTLQGTQLQAYLEQGSLSTPDAWEQLTRVFQGQFFGFAIWFN